MTSNNRVSENLLFASDDSCCSSLALIHEISLFNLVKTKGRDLIDRIRKGGKPGRTQRDRFQETVIERSREFAGLSRGERLLQLIGQFQKLLDVHPRDFQTPFDLSEAADDICAATVDLLRQDKKSQFTGTDTASMIEYQMARMFGGLQVRMEEMSSTEQQSLVEQVRKFLDGLPADQQRFVMEKLGTTELSEAAIRQAITSGALWIAFAAAVEVFGFSFYTTAAHLLAIVSLHLLPFAAYVWLSSGIAVLSSPWMLPIFAGVGAWFYGRKNRALRREVAPLIVTSLCLSGMESRARSPSVGQGAVDDALALWTAARKERDEKREAAEMAKRRRDDAMSQLNNTQRELVGLTMSRATQESDSRNLTEELSKYVRSAIDFIAGGGWGPSLAGTAEGIRKMKAEANRSNANGSNANGSNANSVLGARRLASMVSSAEKALIRQVRSAWPKEGSEFPPSVQSIFRKIEEATSQIDSLQARIDQLKELERAQSVSLKHASVALDEADSARRTSEQRYFGLEAV